MPTVISKFLEKSEKTFQIPRSVLTGAVVATALFAYAYKVGYPIVDSYIHKQNKQSDSLNNNFVAKNQPVKNGVAKPKTRPESRFRTSIPALNLRFILQFIRLVRTRC